MTECTQRLVAAAEALQKALVEISAQQKEMSAKVDRIVAAVEEGTAAPHLPNEGRYGAPSNPAVVNEPTLSAQNALAQTELPHPYAKRRLEGGAPAVPSVHAGRKTLSPLVTMILAKSGVEDGNDAGVIDKALAGLSPEQRIAVKSEMARAGIIQ